MSARGQRTEDRGQIVVLAPRGLSNTRGVAATKPLSSERGFTLLELIVVIIVIVTLMGLFMNRALFYMEQAEKVAMEGVAGAIQSSLTMQYGQILTRGKPSDVAALAQDNPMNWLQKKPRNYAGEFYDPTPLSAESGNWMFDLKSRDLVYVVRHANYFSPGKDGKKWIRFHVAVSHEPSRLPSLQNAPPELAGILFEPVEPYSWF
ncbi:MAG: prepilin-type N-terminal cleavage/methylation domain-containing protein [Nitrosomonadales bacterium]|nr:prepilin-type N-terminal cleavage/methylation domain-containing protein [Nitrosomonadales bacterium]